MTNFFSLSLPVQPTHPLAILALLLATAGAAHAQTPAATFATVALYSTGAYSRPQDMVVADVNSDGKLDLLTANSGTSTAGVLLGNGDGTFKPVVTYDVDGQNVYAIAVADVNGDGKLDILTSQVASYTVGVLLGNGNGTFRPGATFSTGSCGAEGIAVADVNGDGKPDLLTANYRGHAAGVLLGNGDGTFQPMATYSAGSSSRPTSIAVADVNGDGKLDLLTANGNDNTAGVLLGNGNGTFQTATTYGTGIYPSAITIADVNLDGKLDLLTADTYSLAASVLLGNGNGTFQTRATYIVGGGEPTKIAVADVNGDGKPDILTAFWSAASVMLGNGDGTFQHETMFDVGAGTGPSIAVGDVNGDGKPDLLTFNFNHTAGVLLNTSAYTPSLASLNPTSGPAAEVKAYPNPAHESFTVVVPAGAAGWAQAELRNGLGQLVRQQSVALPAAGARLTVPTAGLVAGVYVLRLQAGGTTLTQRVVVQ